VLLLALTSGVNLSARADEPTSEQVEFFEKRIRPLLVEHCTECHGEGRAKGGLRLTSLDALRRGGDSGSAIVAGKPEESLLIEAVSHRGDIKMPPKQRLADDQIADLTKWIEIGAPWPDDKPDAKPETAPFDNSAEQRAFWSFQPVHEPIVPPVENEAWPAGAIDRFILARLEAAGLKPSPPADRRTLIRRVTFDLIGLPPAPEEIEAFVADERPDAWEQLVDRLLMSPHFGERWARHWLDVARYAEDQAHTFQARMYPSGYRYRDWVVRAFNKDLAYDQFVTEQIAGDLLDGPAEEKHDREIAVGFFALGPVYYADAGCAFKASLDELDDRLDTLARGFLGLTIACARCHDHKFDPISQQDYYALAGVFRSTAYREAPLVPREVVEQYDQAQQRIKDGEQAVKKFLEDEVTRLKEQTARNASRYLTAAWRLTHRTEGEQQRPVGEFAEQEHVLEFVLERWQKFLAGHDSRSLPQLATWFELVDAPSELPVAADGKGVPSAVVEAALIFETAVQSALAERDEQNSRYEAAIAAAPEAEKAKVPKPVLDNQTTLLLETLVGPKGLCVVPKDKVEGLRDSVRKAELAALKMQVEVQKQASPPKYAFAHSLADAEPANMKIHIRGDPNRTGDEVPRRFLSILANVGPPTFSQGSGRLELARAVVNPTNPLTARVIVNRLWQQHFGRGLVPTASNFGALGERPTHPELLDYLAGRLVRSGWSLKSLHREILLSATYRQSSSEAFLSGQIDPDNQLLSRMNRRRLDVEAWRDALLAVAGNLDNTVGGPPGNLATPEFCRRTLYGAVSRHNLDGFLRLFDFPDPNITSERRAVTTVPLQQLFVLNSDFMVRQAKALAARVQGSTGGDEPVRVAQAYRLVFGRCATPEEIQFGVEFLTAADSSESAQSALTRWEQYAQVLLAANEFTFID
jgi:cytochrome c553